MQETIAQIVALVLFGNQYLSGSPVTDFWPNSSVFQFDATVRFVILSGQSVTRVETEIAPDPMAWFDWLKAEGIIGLRLHCVPKSKTPKEDRMQAGFAGGGGRWLIEAVRDTETSDFWEARWQVGDRQTSDRKIWIVTYGRIAAKQEARSCYRLHARHVRPLPDTCRATRKGRYFTREMLDMGRLEPPDRRFSKWPESARSRQSNAESWATHRRNRPRGCGSVRF